MKGREDNTAKSDLCARFEDIDLAVPLDDDEASQVLAAEGIDPVAALARLMSRVNEQPTDPTEPDSALREAEAKIATLQAELDAARAEIRNAAETRAAKKAARVAKMRTTIAAKRSTT